jgi:hypothetical protein
MEILDKSCHNLVAVTFALAVFSWSLVNAATARMTVTVPIEVVGENGTTSSVTVEIPVGKAREIRSMWMQVHGLAYADMVSVQVNTNAWLPLTQRQPVYDYQRTRFHENLPGTTSQPRANATRDD